MAACLAIATLAGCAPSQQPPAYHPNAAARAAIAKSAEATVDLSFSGPITAEVHQARRYGDCGRSDSAKRGGDFSVFLLIQLSGATYALTLLAPKYVGPGDYRVLYDRPPPWDSRPWLIVNFGPFMGSSSGGARPPGTVHVNPDGLSGSVDVPHLPVSDWWPGMQKELAIRGQWSCD